MKRSTPRRSAFRSVLLPGLLLSALVGVMSVLLQAYSIVLQERRSSEISLQQVETALVPALSQALWDVNEAQVDVFLDGISQLRGVASVVLIDERKTIKQRGERPETPFIEKHFRLVYLEAGDAPLGDLYLSLSGDVAKEQALGRIIIGSLTVVATVSIAVMLLVVLFRQRLLRPLQALDDRVRNLSPNSAPPDPTDRNPDFVSVAEVGALSDAIDVMHRRLYEDTAAMSALTREIADRKDQLEAVVQQRTAELEEKNVLLAEQAKALQTLVNVDALTGAMSRRHFLELAEREGERATRSGLPLSILAIDIDHFKVVNDTYGHACGDRVLQSFVSRCLSQLRATDLLGRLGGEEFAILLPDSDLTSTLAVAERIRRNVSIEPIAFSTGNTTVTVSIGVAQRRPGALDVHALLAGADEALYDAKRSGRDRIEVAP